MTEDSSFGKRLDFSNSRVPRKTEEYASPLLKGDDLNDATSVKRKKQEEYNRKLRKDPMNVPLWIEFIQFQEYFHEFDVTKRRKLIERKISILKKAIEFNSSELQLILMHLEFADEIEDSTSLMKLWEGYLKRSGNLQYHDNFKLTVRWLNFLQNRFLAFSFDQVNEAFAESFKKLQDPALFKIYFKFLKRCGYTERIIAISQAVIEVNVEYFNYGEVDLEAYDDQWESGSMRHIGDCVFLDSFKPNLYPSEYDNCDLNLSKWLHIEKHREINFWHPIQLDPDDCEGQVIFDDVKDFLILPKTQKDSLNIITDVLFELGNCCPSSLNNFKI